MAGTLTTITKHQNKKRKIQEKKLKTFDNKENSKEKLKKLQQIQNFSLL